MLELEIFKESTVPNERVDELLASIDMNHFESVPLFDKNLRFSTAKLAKNINRNRYMNILPYDYNRVILNPTANNKYGYINASHVIMRPENQKDIIPEVYIATQGPLENTCEDFWQMIWEYKVQIIVMVTGFIEADSVPKCFQYLPLDLNQSLLFGKFTVKILAIEVQSQYVRREIEVRLNQESMRAVHIQHTKWADHTVPGNVQEFRNFVSQIDQDKYSFARNTNNQKSPPLVVHCSAGVGRTGVFIMCHALSRLLQSATTNSPVNISKYLVKLRYQRPFAVRLKDQFLFICRYLVATLRQKYAQKSKV